MNEKTALLIVDPYNDFISDGGKIWPYVRGPRRAAASCWR